MARTNPWANDANAVQLDGIERIIANFPAKVTMVNNSDGDTLTVTPNSGNTSPTPKYMKIRITDGKGNEAFGALNTASPSATFTIDISGLKPNVKWVATLDVRRTDGSRTHFNVDLINGIAASATAVLDSAIG